MGSYGDRLYFAASLWWPFEEPQLFPLADCLHLSQTDWLVHKYNEYDSVVVGKEWDLMRGGCWRRCAERSGCAGLLFLWLSPSWTASVHHHTLTPAPGQSNRNCKTWISRWMALSLTLPNCLWPPLHSAAQRLNLFPYPDSSFWASVPPLPQTFDTLACRSLLT